MATPLTVTTSNGKIGNGTQKSPDKVALLANGSTPNSPAAGSKLGVPEANNNNNASGIAHSRQGSNVSHQSESSSLNSLVNGEIGDCQQGVIVALHRKMVQLLMR